VSTRLEKLGREANLFERQAWEVFWGTVVECSSLLKEIAPSQRRPWLSRVIEEIHESQGGVCPLCGEPLLPNEGEIDHRIPFCYGGGNEPGNLQIAHITCNRRKDTRSIPWICYGTSKVDIRTAEVRSPKKATGSSSMHYLVVGFLVMLGAMAAVASAPMIFAIAIIAAKGLLVLLLIGVIAGVVWLIRVS
jgi:hypothetical protein